MRFSEPATDPDILNRLKGQSDARNISQLRPKAAHGRVRTTVAGAEGERIATVPRGFYLRARFTGAILADPAALP